MCSFAGGARRDTLQGGLYDSSSVNVYAVVDDSLSPTSPLGDAIETFIRREDAERFMEKVRGDDPALADALRIEERVLEAGGLN